MDMRRGINASHMGASECSNSHIEKGGINYPNIFYLVQYIQIIMLQLIINMEITDILSFIFFSLNEPHFMGSLAKKLMASL